jgi:hypothetical protein
MSVCVCTEWLPHSREERGLGLESAEKEKGEATSERHTF